MPGRKVLAGTRARLESRARPDPRQFAENALLNFEWRYRGRAWNASSLRDRDSVSNPS